MTLAMSQLAVKEKWIFFRDTVLEVAKEFVPEKRECKKKKFVPWGTDG